MKPGLRIGQVFEFEIQVTQAMQAQFEDVVVHELYATASMLTHMEWASRQHILPYLEPDEEGFGYQMTLEHLAPVAIGETVRVSAEVTGIKPGRVVCACRAFHGSRCIGRARVVQAILPLARVREKMS